MAGVMGFLASSSRVPFTRALGEKCEVVLLSRISLNANGPHPEPDEGPTSLGNALSEFNFQLGAVLGHIE